MVSPPFRRANMLAINLTAVLLGIILQAGTSAQGPAPVAANYCEVVLSPADYNGKMLSVEGILHPGEHSLTLYGLSCPPKFGGNLSTEAVLPSMWVSLPNGKQLRKLLKKGKNARVKVSGTFESGRRFYGTDGAMFRFTVSEISSVEKAPTDFHP